MQQTQHINVLYMMHGFADSFTIDALRAGAYEMNSEIISPPSGLMWGRCIHEIGLRPYPVLFRPVGTQKIVNSCYVYVRYLQISHCSVFFVESSEEFGNHRSKRSRTGTEAVPYWESRIVGLRLDKKKDIPCWICLLVPKVGLEPTQP